MIAQATRCYGLSDIEILHMPAKRFLRVYVKELPRIQATEDMRLVRALSFPHLKEEAQRAYLAELQSTFRRDKTLVVAGQTIYTRAPVERQETPDQALQRKRAKAAILQRRFGKDAVRVNPRTREDGKNNEIA